MSALARRHPALLHAEDARQRGELGRPAGSGCCGGGRRLEPVDAAGRARQACTAAAARAHGVAHALARGARAAMEAAQAPRVAAAHVGRAHQLRRLLPGGRGDASAQLALVFLRVALCQILPRRSRAHLAARLFPVGAAQECVDGDAHRALELRRRRRRHPHRAGARAVD